MARGAPRTSALMSGHDRARAARPYARTACERCRRHRKKCDGKTPCTRCVRANEPCTVMGLDGRLYTLPPPSAAPLPNPSAASTSAAVSAAATHAHESLTVPGGTATQLAESLRALQSTMETVVSAVRGAGSAHGPQPATAIAPAAPRTVYDVPDTALQPASSCLGHMDVSLTMTVVRCDEAVAQQLFACSASELEGHNVCDDLLSKDCSLEEGFAETEIVMDAAQTRVQGGWERSYHFNRHGELVLSLMRFSMYTTANDRKTLDPTVRMGTILIKWARVLRNVPPVQLNRWGMDMFFLVERALERCRAEHPESRHGVVVVKADDVLRHILAAVRTEESYWEPVDLRAERERVVSEWHTRGNGAGKERGSGVSSGTPLALQPGAAGELTSLWDWDEHNTMPTWE